jgi:hypothetical protein
VSADAAGQPTGNVTPSRISLVVASYQKLVPRVAILSATARMTEASINAFLSAS